MEDNEQLMNDPMSDPIKYCHEHYPEMVAEFKKLQKEQLELFARKQMDYGPGNIKMGTDLSTEEDVKFALGGLNVRMNDKIQRLLHLVNRTGRDPHNESIDDAYKDTSIYGLIGQLVINGKWGK